ncbi:hypothetical protein ACFVRE_38975, partial [Streptomyces sp. NPDC057910]
PAPPRTPHRIPGRDRPRTHPASIKPVVKDQYDKQRAREAGYNPALRQVGNRLVGILHGWLKTRTTYDEATAWSHHAQPHPA